MSTMDILALPAPLANLQQYVAAIEQYPVLEAEEERDLAQRLKRDNDADAAWKLVTSNLRYVVYIARGYLGYGLPQDDLIQEGNIGLMKAVKRFDPERGVRLAVYASYWIKSHIHEFILNNWRLVKGVTTKAKRKLFYKLRSAKQRLEWLSQDEAASIADELGVEPKDVLEMEGQLYSRDESFDSPVDSDDDATWAPEAYLSDDSADPGAAVAQLESIDLATERLRAAVAELDDRSRDILSSRWLADDDDKLTLHQLAERHHVSAERVRQIEAAAIKKLRKLVLKEVEVFDVEAA